MASKRDQQKVEKDRDKLMFEIDKTSGGKGTPDWFKGIGLGYASNGDPQVRVSVRTQADVQKVIDIHSRTNNLYCNLHIEVVGDHFRF